MNETAFWVKWENLEDLYNTLRDTALNLMIQSNFKNDDIKGRRKILDGITKDIIRQAMGVSGGYDVFLEHITEEGHRGLISSLYCLHSIARLYFSVFSQIESGEVNEDTSFCDYLLKNKDIIDDLKKVIKKCDDEDKAETYTELVDELEEAFQDYKKGFNYPQKNESANDYLERVI